MGYLDDLISKGKDDLWEDGDRPAEALTPTESQAVIADRWDRMGWTDITYQSPKVNEEHLALQIDYPTGGEAYEDLFHLLCQGDPMLREHGEMLPDFLGNHVIMDAFYSAPEFEEMRSETRQDEYTTAYTLLAITPILREALDALNNAQEAQQALADALTQAAQEAQQGSGEGEGQGQVAEALEQAQQAAQQATEAVQEKAQQLATAAAEAQQEVEAEEDAAEGFGIGPGQLQRMSFEERRALAEKLNRGRLAKLSALIGGWRQYADAERRRKIKHAPSEVHDYVLGNDLTRLAGEELGNLAVPELEEKFWVRWAQHGLLNREVRGTEHAGYGPIIVVCDESYSMSAALTEDGTREMWSKAISLALLDQAKRGRRDFTYIGFGGYNQMWERSFTAGQASLDDTIEFTEHFFAGGTVFTEPLKRALQIIEDANRHRPDVVFITDGDGHIDADFLTRWHERFDKLDARCYGIQVGEGQASKLKSIAHKVMDVSRLNANPEGMRDLFRLI